MFLSILFMSKVESNSNDIVLYVCCEWEEWKWENHTRRSMIRKFREYSYPFNILYLETEYATIL
jgi:hypothetical protein